MRTDSGDPIRQRITPRRLDVGAFPVHRTLPSRERRLVGPWCFCDHIGPAERAPGQGLQIGPHPHIGLQTFTWMMEGVLVHRDSLGYETRILPGQLNLMTAGRGVAHAEESPPDAPGRLHAVQLWIALPESHRWMAPSFVHQSDLPVRAQDGFRLTVLAGQALGAQVPAPVYSPLVALDLAGNEGARLDLALDTAFEHAWLMLEGEAEQSGETLEPEVLYYHGPGLPHLELYCRAPSRFILIGGSPFQEEILLWWNFVARHPEEIMDAVEDWKQGRRFGRVETSRLPPIPVPDPTGLHLRPGR